MDTATLIQLKDAIDAMLSSQEQACQAKESTECIESPWRIGEKYFIRGVTMHVIGKLIMVTDKELLLTNASWVADSGRFNNALKTGELDEVEPFVKDVIVNRSAIMDATIWMFDCPRDVK